MAAIEDKDALKRFGMSLAAKLVTYKADRRLRDLQMLKDLRQYRAEYDPEVKSKLSEKRSQVYPRNTRLKVIGATAKMMEMMFPASEKNWSVTPERFPKLRKDDLNGAIQQAQQKKAQDAQQAGAQPEPLTSDEVAAAVQDFAKQRARNMESEIQDQLDQNPVEWPQVCKHVVHSGTLYGWGVVEGPLTLTETESTYEQYAQGQWRAVEKDVLRPIFEHVRSWDIYPDMSAKHWNQQEGIFRRFVFSRHDLTALIDREDFLADEIKEYLKTHDEGNYKAETYEAELRVLDQTMNVQKLVGRLYEVYRYFGFVSAKQMAALGVDVPDDELFMDMLVDVWVIPGEGDGVIIKAEKAVFGKHVGDQYHPYFYDDEEEAGLLGVSMPSNIRDSQLKLAAIDRMTMDNAAACLGPITEIDYGRLTRDQKQSVDICAFSTIKVDHSQDPTNTRPVLQSYQPESHITELLELRKAFSDVLDMESNVQPISLGDPSGVGEAFRTSGNFSQLTGAANMMTKDQVRAFDRFTFSVIGATVRWNLQFNPKEEIKGDFQAVARGNISLVAKEVRGAALAQWRTTLSPREQVLIKSRELLVEELKSRDLAVDDILLSPEEGAKALAAYDQAQQQAQQTEQGLTQAKTQKEAAGAQKSQAEAQEIMAVMREKINNLVQQANLAVAKATESTSKAKGVKSKNDLDTVRLLLEQINGAAGGAGKPNSGAAGGKA